MDASFQSILAQTHDHCNRLFSAPIREIPEIKLSLVLREEPPAPILREYLCQEQARVTTEVCSAMQGSIRGSGTFEEPDMVLMIPRSEIIKLDRVTDKKETVKRMRSALVAMVNDIVPEQQAVGPDIEICIDLPDPGGMTRFLYIESKGRATYDDLKLPTVTIDTNVIREWWDNQQMAKHVAVLLNRGKAREIDIAVTSRIHDDIPNAPLAHKINSLPDLSIQDIGSVIRIHRWAVGFDTVGVAEFYEFLYSPHVAREFDQMNQKSRPDWRDWDHLHTHYRYGRDRFLTWDKKILHFSDELRDQLGIIVVKPDEYLRNC